VWLRKVTGKGENGMDKLNVNIKINEGYLDGIVKLAETLEKKNSPCVLEIVEEYVQATLKDNINVTGLYNRRDNYRHEITIPDYDHNALHHYYGPHRHSVSTTGGEVTTSNKTEPLSK
jgi:hypothetical protein